MKENDFERPLDLLNRLKHSEVVVHLKDGVSLSGWLICFDMHLNIVYRDTETNEPRFIRGENIVWVESKNVKERGGKKK